MTSIKSEIHVRSIPCIKRLFSDTRAAPRRPSDYCTVAVALPLHGQAHTWADATGWRETPSNEDASVGNRTIHMRKFDNFAIDGIAPIVP